MWPMMTALAGSYIVSHIFGNFFEPNFPFYISMKKASKFLCSDEPQHYCSRYLECIKRESSFLMPMEHNSNGLRI